MVPFNLKLGHFSKMIMYTDLFKQLTITITTVKQQQKIHQDFSNRCYCSLKQNMGIFTILVSEDN